MPSLAFTPATIVSTSHSSASSRPSGAVSRMPIPKVMNVTANRATAIRARVMLKFSASLACSAAKPGVSLRTSQITSGPTMLPTPPVNRPVSEARCANMPHWRSSAAIACIGTAGGGGVTGSNSLIG